MKRRVQRYALILFTAFFLIYNTLQPMAAFNVAKKGVEVVGYAATAVDAGMTIAKIGVDLWGNEKDKERMQKGMAITGIMTSLMRGDLEGAQAASDATATAFKQKSETTYEPLLEDELADADIVAVGPTFQNRSIGDVTHFTSSEKDILNAQRKDVTVNDLSILKLPNNAKKELVFRATELPQHINQSKIYKLLNNMEILFTTQSIENNIATLIIKRITSSTTAMEIGSIKCSLNELKKGLFIGTTDGCLSIFFKEGNLLKKTTLIKDMNAFTRK